MRSISIYIHWPFCLSLCPYCDFNSHVESNIDHNKWLEAYVKELEYFAPLIRNKKIKSIFFGGGTPSLMRPRTVEVILDKISSLGILSELCEISLEANPTSFEAEKFKQFKKAGINRISLGVQSFDDVGLVSLGRTHSAKEAVKAIEEAGKIFDRYSFDLIYARPYQTLTSWHEELKLALNFARGHISLYQLTIEKGTPFFNEYRSKRLSLPSNDLAAQMYEETNFLLSVNNFHRYEISNYAQEGQECIHNLCYWNYQEYIGIGPGAHGRIHNISEEDGKVMDISAIMTYHKPDKWLSSVKNNGNGIQNEAKISRDEIIEESIMTGTRLTKGINEEKIRHLTGLKFENILNSEVLKNYIDNDFVILEKGVLKLTDKGLLMHNYLIPRLIKD